MKDRDSRLLFERYQLIKEGMSAWPTKKSDLNGQVVFMPAFPPEYTDKHHGMSHMEQERLDAIAMSQQGTPEGDDALDKLTKGTNPKYRPDLDMHLSNANAISVMKALEPYVHLHGRKLGQTVQFNHEDYHYSIPIDIFIAACKGYLANSVGVDEPAIPSHIEPRHMTKTADIIDFHTGAKKPGKMEPHGPVIIHGGRNENYTKNRVMQLLHIANEGKAHGAEQMSIG